MKEPRTSAQAKIKDLDELAQIVADLRNKGQRVVHCHGVFDLLHVGHIRHFKSARQHGDVLVVTITPDHWVNKGPHRPAFHQDLRAEMLASLQEIDYVAINRWPMAIETIHLLRPNFFAKGSEFKDRQDVTGAIRLEEEAIAAVGGQLVFTEDVVFSSSALINRHLPMVSKEASEFLAGLSTRYDTGDFTRYLDNARTLKVLLVGESIIDVYHYCQALGKSGKEPILAVRLNSSEEFAGGVLAVANHLASFCESIRVVSCLGEEDSHEDFIREKLHPGIETNFFSLPQSPTILKRRFIEEYPFQKLFEVYHLKEEPPDAPCLEQLRATLKEILPRYDLVIAADFGHGLLDEDIVQILCERSQCLAVNTQANAANHGFNTVSKYSRADYVCVSENEIRLESRKKRQDLYQIVEDVARKLGCRKITVTRGKQGLLCYDKTEGFVQVPAFVNHFTDRVGAGDAVFAITSLCMAQNAPAEVLSVIGNAVGAMAVSVIGNRSAIDRKTLTRTIISLFK